jgi:hypothetical protein
MSRITSIARRSTRVSILILALAACGTSAADPTAGTASGAAGGTDAAGTAAPAGTTTAVAVTGAQTVTFDVDGGCGKALGDDTSWGGSITTGDGQWLLDITLEGTFEPGTYRTGDHEADHATVFMTDGAGSTYDALFEAGEVTLDEGALSGSIDATLTAADGNQVTIAGPWRCESWD